MPETLQAAPAAPTEGGRRRNDQQERASFYLTGRQRDTHLATVEGLGLRSAQLAPFRRLDALRYDYPLVLADREDVRGTLLSLSGLVDDLLATLATGDGATRLREHAIALETEIRQRTDANPAQLSAVWAAAVAALTAAAPADDRGVLADDLARLTAARTVDGELVACTRDTSRHVVGHLWQLVQRQRISQLTARVAHLRRALEDILDAERASSPTGLAADRLAHSLGAVVGDELDPEAVSRLLTHNRPRFALSDARRDRVRRLLDVLSAQRFVPCADAGCDPERLYEFVYTDIGDAVAAYHERFAATTELAKALVIAEMEADGRYREEVHDALFATWSVADLDTETLELFPEYLVRVDAEQITAQDSVLLLEALAAQLPIKVLVQVNDLLAATSPSARESHGLPAQMLAQAAMAGGRAFVLQCASAALFHARERIVAGSSASGAALFVVYSGEGQWLGDLPHYLASAAAIESRVWPSFAYDPTAGETWAERFTLACNPQQDRDWPVHRITYADPQRQRVALDVPFTAADFWAGDARMADHLALEDGTAGTVVPFAQHVAANPGVWTDELPYLLVISRDDMLHRVLVDRPFVHLTQRTTEQWHRLQELGGVRRSPEALALAEVRAELAEARTRLEAFAGGGAAAGQARPTQVAPEPAAGGVAAPEAASPPARDPDLPWIETARCSTCHECRTVNDRMFRYDDNQQAYLADPDAGTFADLVRAAESCQVAIIHPGKPRNPAEPGLEDLLSRAALFP